MSGLVSEHSAKLTWNRADQNTGGTLLEFSMRTAMHGTSRVSSAISVSKIKKKSLYSFNSGIAQWIRDHRVVKGVGSTHRERRLLELFQQLFLSRFYAGPSEP